MGNRRRRKKKSHRIYAFIVLFLGLAIIAAVIFLLFYVQKIEVKGNDYVTEKEIIETVQNDDFSVNALYILGKYALGKGKTLPCLEQMKVRLKAPWSVKIEVKEKPIVGYIQNGELYDYFDKEGLVVLESSALIEGVPYIEGIGLGEVKLYEHLRSKNTKIFEQILETSREITKHDLKPDRIVCEEDVICLYVGRIRIRLGKNVSAVQIAQIAPILEKIGDKEGTLHLENYSEVQGTITFEEGAFPQDIPAEVEGEIEDSLEDSQELSNQTQETQDAGITE
ncbi:MAG: FtsQ-type POTRA domain-containing protein [Dorea sp.]|uniref:cell division protein FtsQ/DivIB n=1 Tax=Sporofaciens musculi TaxID=2681861 RepID=UPI00216F6AFC|nr:FtsQ-type POTRA domain-containing protein [Sporofaciens musculi]MCI9422922.1 FtsQ-type POTRA domain-containing protein [Dorea sp.]